MFWSICLLLSFSKSDIVKAVLVEDGLLSLQLFPPMNLSFCFHTLMYWAICYAHFIYTKTQFRYIWSYTFDSCIVLKFPILSHKWLDTCESEYIIKFLAFSIFLTAKSVSNLIVSSSSFIAGALWSDYLSKFSWKTFQTLFFKDSSTPYWSRIALVRAISRI